MTLLCCGIPLHLKVKTSRHEPVCHDYPDSHHAPQDAAWRAKAKQRLDQLIMPHWALGRLMDLAMDLAGMTRSMRPPVARKTIVTMAGDHGVAAEGVSKYPQEVTPQMVYGFVGGMAGISALARLAGARVMVVDMGVAADLSPLAKAGKIIDKKVALGTANIAAGPAMTPRAGRTRPSRRASRSSKNWPTRTDVFGTGDMGIANTTPSTAVVAALTGLPVADLTGRGTGIDDGQLARKIAVVEKALALEPARSAATPWTCWPRSAASRSAASPAWCWGPPPGGSRSSSTASFPRPGRCWPMRFARRRASTSLPPTAAPSRDIGPCTPAWERSRCLDLGLRLGEGTGAALAMNLVDAAQRILTEVATFDEAHVSQGGMHEAPVGSLRFLTDRAGPGQLGHGRGGPCPQRPLVSGVGLLLGARRPPGWRGLLSWRRRPCWSPP